MANLPEQFKINLNQNLWALLVAFSALGLSEYYKLPALFWFAVSASLIMTVSIAVTTLAYTITYWIKRADEPSSIHRGLGSVAGWWRLWILCSIIAIFPVVYFVAPTFPTASSAGEARMLQSIDATEAFLEKSESSYKPQGAQSMKSRFYADLSSDEIVSRLHERYRGKVDFSAIEERYKSRLMSLSSSQFWIAATMFSIWVGFSVLLLVFGILVRWVYRGFRDSATLEAQSRD